MMNIKTLSLDESKKVFKEFKNSQDLDLFFSNLPKEYKDIRSRLLFEYEQVKSISSPYKKDLKFALAIYEFFNELDDFNEIVASNYGFWRYICIRVVPDIIQNRHGLIESYYYDKNVRLYFGALWWYIHLTYQGKKTATYNALKDLSTDYILQLVERPGKNGIYLEVSRRIIYVISKLPEEERNKKVNKAILFRRIMMLNNAIIDNYNPMVSDCVNDYVDKLFLDCGLMVKKYV